MTGWWAPAGLYGLHVDFGRYDHRSARWLRQPTARFTCRHGCHVTVVGPLKVAALTARTTDHARTCPGNHQSQNRNERV